jgi:DNA processing protein
MDREHRLHAALALTPARRSQAEADQRVVLEQLITHGIDALLPDDDRYPAPLRGPRPRAPALFSWGRQDLLNRPAVGMCGSRDASPRGLDAAAACGEEVARAGFTIVSGYARGVDTETHLAALREGGVTIIVLAEGILHFKPKRAFNGLPFDEEHVLVVSQFPPQQAWASWAAMARNQVIVSASRALVVIEAGERGGTLDAGLHALRAGRPLFVLDLGDDAPPGNRRLLKQGATAVHTRKELRDLLHDRVSANGGSIRQLQMTDTLHGPSPAGFGPPQS